MDCPLRQKQINSKIILEATVAASAFQTWGILDRGTALADLIRKFGEPEKGLGGASVYGSDHDERAVVFLRQSGANVTQIDWSCR